MVVAATVGAGAHGNHPAGVWHLIIHLKRLTRSVEECRKESQAAAGVRHMTVMKRSCWQLINYGCNSCTCSKPLFSKHPASHLAAALRVTIQTNPGTGD
jgi:hypothetical protein